jgi:hypothetical protein
LPLLGIFIAWVAYSTYKQRANKDWDSGPPAVHHRVDLGQIRSVDPDFSVVVFEDFAFRLYSAAHRSPDAVAPYVAPAARATLAQLAAGKPIEQVIVGAMRPYRVDVPSPLPDTRVRVAIEFEANLATDHKTLFVVETWQLSRASMTRSKPPTTSKTFPCPNCGAPWQSSETGTQKCASCGEIVDNGRFDWLVEQVSQVSVDERPPTLTTEVPERGTDLPTYRDRAADTLFDQLRQADPSIDQGALGARIALIHRDVAKAWSKNDLTPVRGLVSDGLYDYLDYWVQAYKQQGLRNMMKDVRLTKTDLAKVTRDRWYDAVTIRIWATGLDYVIEERTGKVVRGSKRRERPYSEYWTLIRSATRKGPARADRNCGNCGAPLEVTMAGACTHCGAHVTAGEFDWVLSKIEQDDSYRG